MALNKLTVRRLMKLADYMESLPREAEKHFDMGSWFDHKGEHRLDIEKGASPEKRHYFDCGTSACALGWAASMPYFKKAGLRVCYSAEFGADIFYNGFYVYADDTEKSGFLNLSSEQSEFLFGANVKAKTPKQWAARCRKFLKEHA